MAVTEAGQANLNRAPKNGQNGHISSKISSLIENFYTNYIYEHNNKQNI